MTRSRLLLAGLAVNMTRSRLLLAGLAVLVFLCAAYVIHEQKGLPFAIDGMQEEEHNESHKAIQKEEHKESHIAEEPRDFIIPSDDELKKMPYSKWKQIYWTYINRLQTLCKDVVRVGILKDGGKEICADERYRPRAPCTIYSFGINNDYTFDNAAVDMFGCEVYCFDPSMNKASQRISEHVWFYNWGLSGTNTVTRKGWRMKTLGTIRNELGHSNKTIDLLKMDIEGSEWETMLKMIPAGDLDGVRQVAMETHFGLGGVPGNMQLSALRQLYDTGFRIFMRDRNILAGVQGSITTLNEISLIKLL